MTSSEYSLPPNYATARASMPSQVTYCNWMWLTEI